MWKKIAIAAGLLAIVGATYQYGVRKANQLKDIAENMTISVKWISKVIPTLTNISFNLDLELKNNSVYDLSVSGFGMVKLTKIRIFYKNNFLGESFVNLSAITIPNRNSVILKKIPFSVSTKNILANIMTISDISTSNVTIEATISALGQEFTINQ